MGGEEKESFRFFFSPEEPAGNQNWNPGTVVYYDDAPRAGGIPGTSTGIQSTGIIYIFGVVSSFQRCGSTTLAFATCPKPNNSGPFTCSFTFVTTQPAPASKGLFGSDYTVLPAVSQLRPRPA